VVGGRRGLAIGDDPRGGTGKPDTHRLREMLIEVNQPQGTRVQG
jgi:hypothetical protein